MEKQTGGYVLLGFGIGLMPVWFSVGAAGMIPGFVMAMAGAALMADGQTPHRFSRRRFNRRR